jgi:hypothetical protein
MASTAKTGLSNNVGSDDVKLEDGSHKVVPVSDLTPFSGACCFFTSCIMDPAQCFGVSVIGTLCCAKIACFGCKPTCEDPEACCVVAESEIVLLPINKCTGIQLKEQLCCINARCALPTDDEVPCIFAMCFITCCYKWSCKPACFKKFGELDEM